MCKEDIYMLKVSNLGSGVVATLANKEWMVRLPQILQDKGPCTVTLMKARIQAGNLATMDDVAKLWCESSIAIQGMNTEVTAGQSSTGYNELFDVELLPYIPVYSALTSGQPQQSRMPYPVQYRARPYTFRCMGLPPYIGFRALVLKNTVNIGDALVVTSDDSGNIVHLYDHEPTYLPQVEFHLQIVFDSSREEK